MKTLLKSILILFSIIAYKEGDKPTERVRKIETSAIENGCYSYTHAGDSIFMKLNKSGEFVKGTLYIAYAEKDANSGSFTGRMTGDTLVASYTFNAEGLESTRMIIFLNKNNQLMEGYGPMTSDGTKFKNRDSITFSENMPLTLTDCRN